MARPLHYPRLETERLLIREPQPEDAETIQRLLGDREIAEMTEHVPHPYPDGAAKAWIESRRRMAEEGTRLFMAVTRRSDGAFIGAVGLGVDQDHRIAELGYWIGKPYWRNGYATEAVRAVVAYAFEVLELHKVHARVFARNRASAGVLERAGMRLEGRRPEHYLKWGRYEDVHDYGLLAQDYRGTRAAGDGGSRVEAESGEEGERR